MRISDWSSDVCSSDLQARRAKTQRITLMMTLIKAGHGSSDVAFSPLSPTSCWTTKSAGRAETEELPTRTRRTANNGFTGKAGGLGAGRAHGSASPDPDER